MNMPLTSKKAVSTYRLLTERQNRTLRAIVKMAATGATAPADHRAVLEEIARVGIEAVGDANRLAEDFGLPVESYAPPLWRRVAGQLGRAAVTIGLYGAFATSVLQVGQRSYDVAAIAGVVAIVLNALSRELADRKEAELRALVAQLPRFDDCTPTMQRRARETPPAGGAP